MPDPIDPGAPGGPSEQQPNVNANLSDAMGRIASSVEKQAESAERIAEALRRMPSATEEFSRKLRNASIEFKDMVELASDVEEKVKLIAAQTKTMRRSVIDTKNAKEAVAWLKDIVDVQKTLQGELKKGTRAYAASVESVKELAEWTEKLEKKIADARAEAVKFGKSAEEVEKTVVSLADDEMKKLNKSLLVAEKNFESMAKAAKNITLSHLSRQVKGVTGALSTVGIGKGYAARVDKYAKYAEVPYKMREAQKARQSENREAWRSKRDAALEAVKAQYGGNMSDPKAQRALMQRMGISTRMQRRLEADPRNISALMGRGTTADVSKLETHGTGLGGVMSKAATGFESAVGTLGEYLAEFGPIIGVFEESVMLLVAAFDYYVKQNKQMEAGLGKGGLFGTAQGAGGAFAGARRALTPQEMTGGVYSTLGITYERNLKIAQAIVETGQNIEGLVTGGELRARGRVGPRDVGGEFMPGGYGEIQRAVVGPARLAGLTDAEGVQQIMKMLQQYRTTLESSEDFFIKINKDTQAAGISTTKYISILDDVMSRFGRMNKTLGQAVVVLGEMSKTGRIASEDLKGYFDLVAGGAGAQEKTGTATQMFLYGQMSPEERKRNLELTQQIYQGTMARAPAAFAGAGIGGEELKKGLAGTDEDVQKFLTNRVTAAIESSKNLDTTQKQSMNNMVETLRRQRNDVEQAQAFSDKRISAVQYSMGQTMGGTSLLNRAMLNRQLTGFVLKQAAGQGQNLRDLMRNPQAFAAKSMQATGIMRQLGQDPEKMGTYFTGMQRTAAGLRIGEAMGDEGKAKKLFEELKAAGDVTEKDLVGKKGETRSFTNFFKESKDAGKDFTEQVSYLNGTLDYWSGAIAKQEEATTAAEKKKVLDDARKVALQTQSSADIIANAFSKWMTEIISALEYIANSWIIRGLGGDIWKLDSKQIEAMGKEVQRLDKGIKAQQALMDQTTDADEKEKHRTGIQAMQKQKTDLEGVMGRKEARPGHEQELVEGVPGWNIGDILTGKGKQPETLSTTKATAAAGTGKTMGDLGRSLMNFLAGSESQPEKSPVADMGNLSKGLAAQPGTAAKTAGSGNTTNIVTTNYSAPVTQHMATPTTITGPSESVPTKTTPINPFYVAP